MGGQETGGIHLYGTITRRKVHTRVRGQGIPGSGEGHRGQLQLIGWRRQSEGDRMMIER
jgi:hypothetical protein